MYDRSDFLTSPASRTRIHAEVKRLLADRGLRQEELISHLIEEHGAPTTFDRRYIKRINTSLTSSNLQYFMRWILTLNPNFEHSLYDPRVFFRERSPNVSWVKIVPCDLRGFGSPLVQRTNVYVRNRYRFLVDFPFEGYFRLLSVTPTQDEDYEVYDISYASGDVGKRFNGTHLFPPSHEQGIMVGGTKSTSSLIAICSSFNLVPQETDRQNSNTEPEEIGQDGVQALIRKVSEAGAQEIQICTIDYRVNEK